MARIRTHGGRTAVIAPALTVLALVLLFTGCATQTSPTPPAQKPGVSPPATVVPVPTVTPTPETTSSTHQGTVEAGTYAAIVSALKAQGYRFRDEAGLLMRYGDDTEHVTVTGTMMRAAGPRGRGPMLTYSVVEMELKNGQWKVTSAK